MSLYPLGIVEILGRLKVHPEQLLEGTGINTAALYHADKNKISYQQLAQLLKNAIELADKPGLGLITGSGMEWCFMGPVGEMVFYSPSLQQSMCVYLRYQGLVFPHFVGQAPQPFYYLTQDNKVVMPISTMASRDGEHKLQRFELESYLALSLRLFRLCGNQKSDDASVHLYLKFSKPDYHYLYKQLPCDSITYDADVTAIKVSVGFFCDRFRQCRRYIFRRMVDGCENKFLGQNPKIKFSDTIKWHLFMCLRSDAPMTIATMAGLLNISEAMLRRRLIAEDTSFRRLLDSVRMQVADYQNKKSDLNTLQLSRCLGFVDVSNFYRALNRWSELS